MSKSKKKNQKSTNKSTTQNSIPLFTKICAFVLALLTVLSIFSGFFF